jgi:hypothetical protein
MIEHAIAARSIAALVDKDTMRDSVGGDADDVNSL